MLHAKRLGFALALTFLSFSKSAFADGAGLPGSNPSCSNGSIDFDECADCCNLEKRFCYSDCGPTQDPVCLNICIRKFNKCGASCNETFPGPIVLLPLPLLEEAVN